MVGGGSCCGDGGGVSTGGELREVMMTSLPDLAHCGGWGGYRSMTEYENYNRSGG